MDNYNTTIRELVNTLKKDGYWVHQNSIRLRLKKVYPNGFRQGINGTKNIIYIEDKVADEMLQYYRLKKKNTI